MRSWPEFPLVRKAPTSGAALCRREVEPSAVTKIVETKILSESSVRDRTLLPVGARGATVCIHNWYSLSKHILRGEYE